MKIKFYGVRGSCPAPGKDTVKYGGNTACVKVTSDDGRMLILDAGTGIRQLGQEIKHIEKDIHILLSHNHWDHIQGFPFFIPAYLRDHTINIYPGTTDSKHDNAVLEQMSKTFFPVHYQHLNAKVVVHNRHKNKFKINGFRIQRFALNHPGGGSGYIIEADKQRLAYITDNELNTPGKVRNSISSWTKILNRVDLLIHDAQFIPHDMPLKSGWGHTIAEEAVALAKAAKVRQLALYSHDPERTDEQIDSLIQEFDRLSLPFPVTAAMEGQSMNVALAEKAVTYINQTAIPPIEQTN